uniref:RHEB like 1 n=1 Tax=Ornithorhynchus anatinus TaxID=9258 RepID=A0A6I8PLW5_ORNAN
AGAGGQGGLGPCRRVTGGAGERARRTRRQDRSRVARAPGAGDTRGTGRRRRRRRSGAEAGRGPGTAAEERDRRHLARRGGPGAFALSARPPLPGFPPGCVGGRLGGRPPCPLFRPALPPPPPGKTSLAHQFVDGEFLECYDPTVESTYSKTLTVGKDEFHLQLMDTAGQDEYSILPQSFVIGVHGYVLVYSVTSLRSFQVVKSLHHKLYESRGKTRMPVVLVGNKADLSPKSREVRTEEGKKLAESWGAIFLESSARESQVCGLNLGSRGWPGAGRDLPSSLISFLWGCTGGLSKLLTPAGDTRHLHQDH